jgi:acyl carrier protein
MDREQKKAHLIKFLQTIQRPDVPVSELSEELSLVDSGLIDSLALLQIITYLEDTYDLDFRDEGINPGDLHSVGAILDLIAGKSET